MTRLVTCGWETGNPDENQSGAPDAGWGAVTTTPTPKAPSLYCLKNISTASVTKYWQLAAAKTDLYVRAHVYVIGAGGTTLSILQLSDSAAGVQIHMDIAMVDNLLRVYRGSGTTNLLGASSLPMPLLTWHLVELRWQATSATSGIVQVWLNGTLVINLSGVDNTATANVNVQRVELVPTATGSLFVCYDDLAVNDTAGTINNGQIGEGVVVMLKPNGAGSNTAQSRGGTDSGNNWDQCNELPVSMNDYVYSAVAATRDTYALEDLPSGSWTVNAVEVVAYAQNSDTGAGSLGLTVKSGATTNEGAAQALGSTPLFLRQLYETDPATSAAWTNAAVNALEAGTTVR